MRVIIIASAVAMRIGLRTLLQFDEEIEIIAEAASWVDLFHPEEADVLLWFPENYESLQGMTSGQVEVLPALVCLTEDPQIARELIRLPWRAWAILSPEGSTDEILAAVRAVHSGLLVSTPRMVEILARRDSLHDPGQNRTREALTAREGEVLQLLAQGLANKQIGLALGISEHTVKFHVSAIYAKLGAASRTEAVRLGVQRGLISL